MHSLPAPVRRLARLLGPLLVVLAAARVTAGLWAVAAADGRLPQWDPAKYGAAGVRLADAVRGGEVGELLRQVNRLSLWPPLYPLVGEMPVFLVFGGGYRVADGVAGGLVVLAALAAFAGGRAVLTPLRNGAGASVLAAPDAFVGERRVLTPPRNGEEPPAGGVAWGRRALGGGRGGAPACAPLRAGSGRTAEGQPRARVEPPGDAVRRRGVTPGGGEEERAGGVPAETNRPRQAALTSEAGRSGGAHWCLAAEFAGGLAAVLMLVSPAVHLFGTLSMLEVPGAMLTLVALWTYARSLESGRGSDWRVACAAATALFFLKYNYGLLWLAPLALSELWIAAGEEGVVGRVGRWVRKRRAAVELGRAWTWFVLGYLVLLGALAVTGGWDLVVGGRRLGVHGLGNPVYLLVLLVVARYGLVPRRRRVVVAWYRGLGERGRTALGWIGTPIAVWLLVPPHLKDFFQFVENRNSGLPAWSLAGLGFYPRAFVNDYSPHPAVGVAVVLLATVPFAYFGRLTPARRALALAVGFGAAALVLHPYKLERFLFTLAPLVWLSAAGAAADGVGALGGWLARRHRGALRASAPALAAVVAVAILLAWIALPASGVVDRDRLVAARAARTVPASVRPLLDELADVAARSEGTVLLGAWNGLSPALVEWHLRLRHPGIDPARVPLDAARLASATSPLALLDRAARTAGKESDTERLLLVDSLDDGPEGAETFRTETAWLDPLRTALPTDPRFTLESDHPFPTPGYRLRVYRIAP